MKKRPKTRFRTIKPERMKHGTRGCYVAQKCRCAACKFANRIYYHERMERRLEQEAGVTPNHSTGEIKLFTRTSTKGRKYTVRGRACPGVNRKTCVAGGAWLRRGHGLEACAACVERATVWNGLVDVGPALSHMRRLSKLGIGYRAVAAAADVATSLTGGIVMGAIKKCRAHTLRKILAVDEGARADHSVISSERLVKNFRWLKREGFTLRELSKLLGYGSRTGANALLLTAKRSGHVVAITDAKVDRLCNRVDAGEIEAHPKLIAGGKTRKLISKLLDEGFNKKQLSQRVGVTVASVLSARKIRPSTAAKVLAFYDSVMAGDAPEKMTQRDAAVMEISKHLDLGVAPVDDDRDRETEEAEEARIRRRLLAAYADGVEMADLEERFGKTADAIRAIASRAGVARAEEREEVVA